MQNTVELVDVEYNYKSELCATLTNGVKAVRCEDVLYLDFVSYAAMCAVYEEWCELADAGEDGYFYVKA
jgi:hypothetical protein